MYDCVWLVISGAIVAAIFMLEEVSHNTGHRTAGTGHPARDIQHSTNIQSAQRLRSTASPREALSDQGDHNVD